MVRAHLTEMVTFEQSFTKRQGSGHVCAQGKSSSGHGDGKDKNPEAWSVAGTRGRNLTAARAGEEWEEVRAEGQTMGI